ncbi:MAG: hypothetical protein V4710_06930, partial [Verrucomicrobiota bacterium]
MKLPSFTAALSIASVILCAPIAPAQPTTTTTSLGTVSEVSPDALIIRSSTETAPLRYSYTKSTTYVDETGAPVSLDVVRSGLPVTVHYTEAGGQMLASKVIVRRQAAPVVRREETTTIPAPVQERTTVVEKSAP